MNYKLISFLKERSDFAPVAEFESALDLSRDALFSDIEALIEEGYSIEFHPYLGVKLVDIPDRLLKHEIRDDLNTRRVGRKVEIFSQVGSTNEVAWELLEAESSDNKIHDGTLIIADSQTRARGRMGREWHSANKLGLWFSVICRTGMPPEKLPFLTACAALAVASMLQQFVQLPAEIKWPNDVMIRGRKVCGVLVEARSNVPDTFVMGVGLNVNHLAEDFPQHLRKTATSLRLERPRGQVLNRIRVLRPLLFYIDRVYRQVRRRQFDKVAKAWAHFVLMGGKHVRLREAGEEFMGVVLEIDPAKGITLKLDESDETRSFRAEAVTGVREVQGKATEPTGE